MNNYIDMMLDGVTYSFSKATSEISNGIYVHFYNNDGSEESRFYFDNEIPDLDDLGWWLNQTTYITEDDGVFGTVRLVPSGEPPVYIKSVEEVSVGDIRVIAPKEKLISLGRTLKDSDLGGDWLDVAYAILYEYDEEWNDREEFSIDGDDVKVTRLK